MAGPDAAVRTYLLAVREPEALRDEKTVRECASLLQQVGDPLERLALRQRILDEQRVDPARFEDDFVAHAKEWALSKGITHAAFQAEGVTDRVLRRAGFAVPRNAVRPLGRERDGGRRRVSADEVRAAIPGGMFTVRDVETASGASTAVVRRVIHEEVAAGNVREDGKDPDHGGPGRSPVVYTRAADG